MAAAAGVSKSDLIEQANKLWAGVEAASRKAHPGFDKPMNDGSNWTAGDVFRHIVDINHRTPEWFDQILKTGSPDMSNHDAKNAEGVKKTFGSLIAPKVTIEMETAHRIVWMALQTISQDDFDREFKLGDRTMTVGGFLQFLLGHEQGHCEAALKVATS
jgi:hypothetical protein